MKRLSDRAAYSKRQKLLNASSEFLAHFIAEADFHFHLWMR